MKAHHIGYDIPEYINQVLPRNLNHSIKKHYKGKRWYLNDSYFNH